MRLILFLLSQAVVLVALAADHPLASFCQPFSGAPSEIIWEAPTNGIPTTVKIFTVVPTHFSPAVISNLLQIAELDQTNKMRPVLSGKGVLTYENKQGTRHLDIVPSEGTIAMSKMGVIAGPKEAVTGVPSTNEAVHRIYGLLPMLGILKSEIATNLPGKAIPYTFLEQTDFHKNKATGQVISNIISRGVSLTRQIDGIPVWGVAGIFAHFGNEGNLANLTVTWRSIAPRSVSPVPSPAEFITLIKSGRVLVRNEQAAAYKKLTIQKIALYYWESDGSEQQSSIYPFAVMEAKTDLQEDNSNVELFVPIADGPK